MRVVWLMPSYAPAYGFGGPVESSHRMCVALRRASIDVRVVTTHFATPEDEMPVPVDTWTEFEGVPVFYARRVFRHVISPSFASAARAELRRADVAHVTGVFDATVPLGLLMARLAGRRVVLSPRGTIEPWSLSQKRWKKAPVLAALRPLIDRVDALHSTSEKEKNSLRILGFARPTVVVPNAVDIVPISNLEDRARRWREGMHLRTGQGLLLMLGRIHHVKGIDVAIDALAQLRAAGRDAVLTLAGPDDALLRAQLCERASQLGVADALRWVGMVVGEEKYALLHAADLLLLPSRQENFGNVVVEALSVETPVLASRDTPWQVLESAAAGRWLPLDAAAFAGAARELLAAPERRAEMGRAGRRLVEERYTWDVAARQMGELYASVIAPS